MENSKKNLKIMSICILICTAITLVRLVLELVYAGVKGQFEASKGIVLASLIITFVIAFIILLPQIYVGLKGLKIAKNPDGSKTHITCAIVLLVISICFVVFAIVDLIKAKGGTSNITALADNILDAVILFLYVKYAREVQKLN